MDIPNQPKKPKRGRKKRSGQTRSKTRHAKQSEKHLRRARGGDSTRGKGGLAGWRAGGLAGWRAGGLAGWLRPRLLGLRLARRFSLVLAGCGSDARRPEPLVAPLLGPPTANLLSARLQHPHRPSSTDAPKMALAAFEASSSSKAYLGGPRGQHHAPAFAAVRPRSRHGV